MTATPKTALIRLRRHNLMALFVLTFSAASLAAMVSPALVSADQIQLRSIKMSDSAPSGTVPPNNSTIGTGSNVTYKVRFNAATSGTIQGIVVSFCDNTPFLADTGGCTAVTGFSLNPGANSTAGARVTVTNVSGLSTGGTWVATTGDGTTSGSTQGTTNIDHVLKYSNSGAATSTAAGSTVEFDIAGVQNPSTTNHSFYARIVTYTTTTGATAYGDAAANTGTPLDYGGIALSTSNQIQITARVQETLMFCVSATAPAANCGGSLTVPDLVLGHGTTNTLDATQVDRRSAYSQISTNAINGAVIRMRNSNLCGGLSRLDISAQTTTSGCDIPAINNNASNAPANATLFKTPAAGSSIPAAFGVNVSNGTAVGTGTGVVTASPYYNTTTPAAGESASDYVGMNLASNSANPASNPGVNSTYGDSVASSTGPVSNINNEYQFAAIASNVTPAGIYRANMMLIATGTY